MFLRDQSGNVTAIICSRPKKCSYCEKMMTGLKLARIMGGIFGPACAMTMIARSALLRVNWRKEAYGTIFFKDRRISWLC